MKFEELKALYPRLWQKAQEKYRTEAAQKRYFKSLLESAKAQNIERRLITKKNREERKRRARALILFALIVLEKLDEEEVVALLDSKKMTAKEGKNKVIDYSYYLLEELRRIKESREASFPSSRPSLSGISSQSWASPPHVGN